MSEDYKKIALEDVKKGQRVRVVEHHPEYVEMYEGIVEGTELEWGVIKIGAEPDGATIFAGATPGIYILLLEDVPKPKVVRTETVTITHYDDGTTTTQTSVDAVPSVIETPDQFEEYEEYLKQVVLKDGAGDYWTYRDGLWCWGWHWAITIVDGWKPTTGSAVIKANLPMTIVENIGD